MKWIEEIIVRRVIFLLKFIIRISQKGIFWDFFLIFGFQFTLQIRFDIKAAFFLLFLLFSHQLWFPSEGKLPKIWFLFLLFLLFKSFQLIIVTFLAYFHPFNLYRYIFVQFLTELFLTQSTKFRRFTLFFLHWHAVRANGWIYTFISSFFCFTIYDVVAFLTGRNQGKDVLIVKQHVFIGISLRYGLLNELKALLIDECVVIESNTAIFEPISTLNA